MKSIKLISLNLDTNLTLNVESILRIFVSHRLWFRIVIFLLLFNFNVVFCGNTNWCDNSALQYLSPFCYGKCVIRANPLNSFQRALKEKFFGQKHVQDRLIEMWENYLDEVKYPSFNLSPISFHIAGDNGVGKTYMIRLMAEALFQYTDIKGDYDGLLVLSGINFKGSDEKKVEENIQQLTDQIIHQLEKCPQSIIVIDEVEYVHSKTLLGLQPFLDSTGYVVTSKGKKVSTKACLFGLISDFGQEGRTENMAVEELEKLVINHTKILWNSSPKASQLIQYTFPFLSLSDSELEKVIEYKIVKETPSRLKGKINSLSITSGCLAYIRKHIRSTFPHENGRGVDKWITVFFLPKLNKAIQNARLSGFGPFSFDILLQGGDFEFIAKNKKFEEF